MLNISYQMDTVKNKILWNISTIYIDFLKKIELKIHILLEVSKMVIFIRLKYIDQD